MRERAHLLHNMSAPSRSVITFSGITQKTRKGLWKRSAKEPVVISVKVNPSVERRSPLELLIDMGVSDQSDPESTLIRLINERANEIPLPDGCAVINYQPDRIHKWNDALTQLAVICKASRSVWLRSKEPRLSLINERRSVSLFLPFGFGDK